MSKKRQAAVDVLADEPIEILCGVWDNEADEIKPSGKQTVPGFRVNQWFAVTRALAGWHVTHLPTGMTAGGWRKQSRALRTAIKLSALGDRWDFTDPKQAQALMGEVADVLKARDWR